MKDSGSLRWRVFPHVYWIWIAWERLWLRLHPVEQIQPGSLFAWRRDHDVLELHLDGRRLAAMRRRPGYSGWKVIHELREDLGVVAGRVRAGELGWMRGIRGRSLMGEVGPVVGFEVHPLPHSFAMRLQQYFLVGLDALYHPRGLRARSRRRWPAESWMDVDALLARYDPKSSSSTKAR